MNPDKLELEYNQKVKEAGLWFLGRFFYCHLHLTRSLINLRRNFLRFRKIVNFIAICFSILGLISLAWWIYEEREALLAYPWQLLNLWEIKHPLIFFFLISLVFDLFIYYRNSVDAARAIKIKKDDLNIDVKNGQFRKKGNWNVSATLDEEAMRVIEEGYLLSSKLKQKEFTPRHLFRALLANRDVQAMFIRLGVKADLLIEKVDKYLTEGEVSKKSPVFSEAMKLVMIAASLEAVQRKKDATSVLDLTWPCYDNDEVIKEILYDLDVDGDKMKNVVEWFRVNDELSRNAGLYLQAANRKPAGNMNRSYTAIATPTLDHFSHDITAEARAGKFELCVGRERELNSIFEAFAGGHCGVLVVGPVGIGKKSIIEGLAQMMVKEDVPKFLQDKRLIELDVSKMMAGASAPEAEERLLSCLYEANHAGNIILFIPDLENLMGISSGGEQSMSLSDVLSDAISRQALYCLSTASSENYTKYIEGSSLGDVMTTVGVSEVNFNQTILILESKAVALEARYGIYLTYEALDATVKLANKYLKNQSSPLKAVNLLQKSVAYCAKAARNNPEKAVCGSETVAAVISEMTGIPATKISENESQKLLNLENEISTRMVGQEDAVKAVCASLRRARTNLKDSNRPIASFLFLGPTGVGKTELAKTVSQVYFGDENYMIRLDMSEYQQADSVDKMIGNPDGTLGYLTEAVRKKPFSLILLDEIEKANPDILNLFLQLLDDGRLTDGQGRTISFAESIIIATSNIGSVSIQEEIKMGIDINLIKQDLIDNQLNKYMRPELINRFDGIVVFKPLSEDNIVSITTLMLKKIKKNLVEKGLDFKADKDGVAVLAKQGYDPKFGARPLRRLLQEKVEDEIANLLLAGKLKRRDVVFVDNYGNIGVEKGRML